MAGGTWSKLVGKERPGTYINFETTETNLVGISPRGTVIMPLLNYPYGPAEEFITIDNSSPDANYSKLGYSVYEKPLLLVKEALKCAKTVIVYIPAQGAAASGEVCIDEEAALATEANGVISEIAGQKDGLTGCKLAFDESARKLTMVLTGPVTGVKNTGIFDTVAELIAQGFTVTVGGTPITNGNDFKGTPVFAQLAELTAGGDDVTFDVSVSKDDVRVIYTAVIAYPTDPESVDLTVADQKAATGVLKGEAKYGGPRGNDLSFDCVANEEDGYDVNVYLENVVVETFEGLTTVGQLIDAGSAWVTFTGDRETELTDFSAISLTGGAAGTSSVLSMTKFLDASEAQVWNTMAFPVSSEENSALLTALVSKIKYLREDVGKYRNAVVADYVCDYEGVINVANSYKLSDGTALTHAEATAWVAGASAGADCVTSNTYKVVEDAADIVDLFSHAEAVAAIKAGKFFFSFNEQSQVAVEYDINSLTSYGDGKKAKSWRKNRVLRVLDSFGESCQVNFPPNKYDNDEDGWAIMEGIGKTILKLYGPKSDGGMGAIRNIDYDNDFKVDQELSTGDEVYFNVGIQPVDSAEKLFFTIRTR